MDRAFDRLDRAYAQRDSGLSQIIGQPTSSGSSVIRAMPPCAGRWTFHMDLSVPGPQLESAPTLTDAVGILEKAIAPLKRRPRWRASSDACGSACPPGTRRGRRPIRPLVPEQRDPCATALRGVPRNRFKGWRKISFLPQVPGVIELNRRWVRNSNRARGCLCIYFNGGSSWR